MVLPEKTGYNLALHRMHPDMAYGGGWRDNAPDTFRAIYGQLVCLRNFPPHSEEEWQSSFNAYKTSPEYKQINSYFGLEDFKSIYWWEYIHRTIGRMIGVVFLIPFIYFLLRFKIPRPLLLKLTCIFCLGGLQGLLGWYMVKSGLVNDPHVSHYRLAAHLLTAFITFGFTLWVILELKINNEKLIMKNEENPINSNTTYPLPSKGCAIKRWSYLLLIFIVVQIIYGALTAGLRAGQFDTTFPKMGSSWIAPEVTSLSPLWRNFTEGVAGVQFIHCYNAYIVVIITCVLWFNLSDKS